MQLKYVFASHSRTLEVTENSSHYTYKQEQKVFVVVEEDCLHAADIYVCSHSLAVHKPALALPVLIAFTPCW